MSWAPTREQLVRLEAKYSQLLALRQAHDRGEPVPDKLVFKSLADEFPGALRELDTLPLAVIETRVARLRDAIESGSIEPWMAWMIAYHALLRRALSIKVRTAKHRSPSDDRTVFLARTMQGDDGFVADEQFIHDVIRPRAGRLNLVVMERLEAMFDVPAQQIRSALFPRRRD